MDPKTTKAQLMLVAATLAAGVVNQLVDQLPTDSDVKDPAVQKVVQLTVKLTEEFYPYLLAAHSSNGTNPDGSANAYVDPGSAPKALKP